MWAHLRLALVLSLTLAHVALADVFIVSDTEGSADKIDAFVREGKLKWVKTPNGNRLDFVNPHDSLVFLGDLSGPNWLNAANPQNIFIRNVFLDLKTRYPSRFDIVLGNHEYNRFGFIRENVLMQRGQHPEYSQWLKEKNLADNVENRVTFWGSRTYGVNKEGISLPVADYQKELANNLGRSVSVKEAAEQFAVDLHVGKPGEPHGKMLQFLLAGQESTFRAGYAMTHAPLTRGAAGITPLQAESSSGGASWLEERNSKYFRPQLDQFIAAIQKGEVPNPILPDTGDARWDAEAKRVVHDSASVSYTERAKEGDQLKGIDPEVASRFANDPKQPALGVISGHKPAGNFSTVHRQEVNGLSFFDVGVDTSRGPNGMYSTVTLKDNGDLVVSGVTTTGKHESWIVNKYSDPLIGKVTDDGFQIKGVTHDGHYILEKYNGWDLVEKEVPKGSIDPTKTAFSLEDRKINSILRGKVAALEAAIRAKGGQVLENVEEASRLVGGRFVLDLRGASKWAAVDTEKAAEIRAQLTTLAERLDPHRVVILTGGNRAGHPNAVENMVHDIFAGADAKKKFDIVGFMKHDTPADEVNPAVRYAVLVGDGDNWDVPVQAAQKFVAEHQGATVMWGGGGILERALETPTAAQMKGRTILVQGFGGASENKAARGTAVKGIDQILNQLSHVDKSLLTPPKLKIGIYSGSFDPPHLGHKNVVDEMKRKFGLDIVYVVPDKTTAYKPGMQEYSDRKKMVELMFKGDPGVRVLTPEMESKLGKGEMGDVLATVKAEHPDAHLFNIMGTDTFKWYEKLPKENRVDGVTFLVNNRDRSVKLPEKLDGSSVVGVELNDQGYSSSAIREHIRAGTASPQLTPEVAAYIDEQKLYKTSPPPVAQETGVIGKQTLIQLTDAKKPPKKVFVKDAPVLAYRIKSDRFEDIPAEIRGQLGAVDKTKYTAEYLRKKIGSVIALQMNGDKPDFYVIGKDTFEQKYQLVPLESVSQKNGKYFGKVNPHLSHVLESHDSGLVGVLKTTPVEMIKMSDLGYPADHPATIESPWGEQTKLANQDAFLVWDEGKKQYYMVNAGVDGNPLSYVSHTSPVDPIVSRIQAGGELAPLPEAKPLMVDISKALESPEMTNAIKGSKTLQMMRERLKTSLYHLNLQFKTVVDGYPYDPPFKEPFPFRPTVEAMDEATRYFETVAKTTGYKSPMTDAVRSSPFFAKLSDILASQHYGSQEPPRSIQKSEIVDKPVDSYVTMQERLENYGETASFPEFATEVNQVLHALDSPEVLKRAHSDPAFALQRDGAIAALHEVQKGGGAATNLQKAFDLAYPYRRTIQSIEKGLMVLDLDQRIRFPETENWHEVELSWYKGEQPKLRPLYHFNRYKYQMPGLLANPEVVILPFDEIDQAKLMRLRAAPWALLGVTTDVHRVDRFHHTSLEEWYHDANHARRMWGYDKRKQEKLGITTKEQKVAVYRQQDEFVKSLLEKTSPTTSVPLVNEERKLQRATIFETFHETALTPDPESLIKDLERKPNTPQPFERQEQKHVENIEEIRTFDGNLKSGADALPLNLEAPTDVIYFYDRAPGFLTNVDNKLRWGFHDSVFKIDESIGKVESRTPEFLATSALDLMKLLGHTPTITHAQLTHEILDRAGQPELYNYYGLDSPEVRDLQSARAPGNVVTGLRVPAGSHAASETPTQFAKEMPTLSDDAVITRVSETFPEMNKLAGKVHATPEGLTNGPIAGSPSLRLFGEAHTEFDRTAVGLLTMKWVLADDYEQFTKSQAAGVKMSRENFEQLRAYTKSILKTPQDVDAMMAYMVINDLGKIDAVVKEVEERTQIKDVDHDKILLAALKEHPEISPSFQRLSQRHKDLILKGLEAKFNIGQFIQGENVAASLNGLRGLDQQSLDFYLLHAVYDIAGAAGHVNPNGSVIMTDPTYNGFKQSIAALEGLGHGKSAEQVYDGYIQTRAKDLGLNVRDPLERAATRVSLMVRATSPADAQEVVSVMKSLSPNVREILITELNRGASEGVSTLLYYSPAMIANLKTALKKAGDPNASKRALEMGMTKMAELYQEAKIAIKGRKGNGVFTLNIAKVAESAKTPETFLSTPTELKPVGADAEVALGSPLVMNTKEFAPLSTLGDLPGERFAVVGIGGGSDGIQAAQVGKLLEMNGKKVPIVISVRTAKPTSQGPDGKTAEVRTIQNHGGEVAPGVFRVKPKSSGSGRFLENIPADRLPMYLVIDQQDGTLTKRIEAAIKDAGGVNTVVAVDTGGDALYHSQAAVVDARATPDQDMRVLKALSEIHGPKVITAEIAVGVDSPPNAQEILKTGKARYYSPNLGESKSILETYRHWKMDGTEEARFGKTPLAWQASLNGQEGLQALPLPTKIVMDGHNPWNPFVRIDPSMRGIFFMDLHDHLAAIGVPPGSGGGCKNLHGILEALTKR